MNMKNIIKWFLVLLIFPVIAMAQEAVSLTSNTPFLRTRQFFYLNIGVLRKISWEQFQLSAVEQDRSTVAFERPVAAGV
jgi:hypothetical protein